MYCFEATPISEVIKGGYAYVKAQINDLSNNSITEAIGVALIDEGKRNKKEIKDLLMIAQTRAYNRVISNFFGFGYLSKEELN